MFRLARRYARRGLPHERYTSLGARLLPGGSGFKYFIEREPFDSLDAVAANLQWAQDAARKAGVEPFAVDASPLSGVLMGLERSAVNPLLAALHEMSADAPLMVGVTVHGGPNLSGLARQVLDGGPVVGRVEKLDVYANYREPSTDRRFTATHACTLEVWDEDDEGGLVAPSSNGRASVIAAEDRRRSARHPARELDTPTFPPLAETGPFEVAFPVDVVYLWVDGGDPAWQRRKADRLVELGAAPHAMAVDNVRFEQGDELRFSLRSLHRYAPWVRRIFVVTDRQSPAWLKEDPGRLDIVDHTDILPPSCLPTFNSHAITAAVHRMPGLSDRFLLMNDDVILGRPVTAEQFFFSNGATKFFNSRAALPSGSSLGDNPPVVSARKHSREVVHGLTGMRPNRGFKHTPIAFDRSLLAELEDEIPEWRTTMASPFRSGTDIVPEWLHHYLGYHRHRAYPASLRYSYVNIGDTRHLQELRRRLRTPRPDVLCVNDVTDDLVGGRARHEALHGILSTMLPWPSPFEADSPPV